MNIEGNIVFGLGYKGGGYQVGFYKIDEILISRD